MKMKRKYLQNFPKIKIVITTMNEDMMSSDFETVHNYELRQKKNIVKS